MSEMPDLSGGAAVVAAARPPALWPSPWPAEDGGPDRRQAAAGGLSIGPTSTLAVTSRLAIVSTMVVLRDPGEVYLLGAGAGPDVPAWVEQIHPETLEPVRRSVDLAGGPMWPGGIAAHANGSLYTVFGRHAHRLAADLTVQAVAELPRDAPHNSFVVLPDGHLVTKDFGGRTPHRAAPDEPCELLVLEPDELRIVARLELPETSVARLSAAGDTVYAVGDTSLWRAHWDGSRLELDTDFRAVYRTSAGQGYGWDAVIDGGAAWFLDNGEGTDRFAGTFRGVGVATDPLHLVRVDLGTGAVSLHEVCGRPGGLIANPPAIDVRRGIAVAYDSGNGVVRAFTFDDHGVTGIAWTREQNHAAHPLRFVDTGELLLCDHDAERMMEQAVLIDIVTGAELARVDTGLPLQSVVFAAPGFGRDLYLCSLPGVCRIEVR
jgi:hypothetical protein